MSPTFCGSQIETEFDRDNNLIYNSALIIIRCRNVKLNGLTITGSRGLGLAIFNHQGGTVDINSTTFIGDELPQEYIKHTNLSLIHI